MNDLTVTEYKDQRVLTTQQLAEAYGTNTDIVTKNFNRNKDRYIEGKHYIALEGNEKNNFLNQGQFDRGLKNAKILYLWTEKGAFLHAKSLNTDKAWEVYDRLVDSYFAVNKQSQKIGVSKELQLMQNLVNQLVEQELKQKEQQEAIERVQDRVESIRDVVAIDSTSWREDTKNLLTKIAMAIGGGSLAYSNIRKESYDLLEARMGVNLKQRLTNKRRRMAEEGVCKSTRDKLSYVDIIADDKKLIEGYVAISKEMAIKYGIA